MVQMFVPSVSRPTRQDVEKEIQKIYPDAKLMSFLPKDLEPGEPTVMMGEELDKKDKPFVKKLVGKLRKGSKTHAKQADDLEKAVEEEFGGLTPKQEREYLGLSGSGIRKLKKDMTRKGNFDVKKNLARKTPDEQHTTTTSEAADLPKFSQDSVDKAKGADSSFVKPNGNKPKVTMKDQINRIKNDPKGKKAKEDAMKDMGEETINELSLDTLSQAARVAMTKRDAARGTSDYMKRQKQTEKFTNAAVKKRRELDATKDKLGKVPSKGDIIMFDEREVEQDELETLD